jgi:ABC transporter substrate binding protein/Ornithine cyclodeaminase/mu-crystallin family
MAAHLRIDVIAIDDLREGTLVSDAIVTCTSARTPFLGIEDVRPGTFVAAVGADNPQKSEIKPELMAKAAVIVRVDTHWATTNATKIRQHAAELAAKAPDVILTGGTSTAATMLQATRTVPIVFATVVDPVGSGLIDSLARPGGNATGFLLFEYSLGGKWLELLKQIAPTVTRVAVLRDTSTASGTGQFGAIQAVAPSLKVDVVPVNMGEAADLERAIATFARSPNGGLILAGSGLAILHRDLIIALAARHKLPAIYYEGSMLPQAAWSPTGLIVLNCTTCCRLC